MSVSLHTLSEASEEQNTKLHECTETQIEETEMSSSYQYQATYMDGMACIDCLWPDASDNANKHL